MHKKAKQKRIKHKTRPLKVVRIEDSAGIVEKQNTRRRASSDYSTLQRVLERLYDEKTPPNKTICSFLLDQSKTIENQKRIFFALKHGMIVNNRTIEKIFFSIVQRNKAIFFPNTYLILLCSTLHLLKTQSEKKQRILIFILLFKILSKKQKQTHVSFNQTKKQNIRERVQGLVFDQNELIENSPPMTKTKQNIEQKLIPFLQTFIYHQKELRNEQFLACAESCFLSSMKFISCQPWKDGSNHKRINST